MAQKITFPSRNSIFETLEEAETLQAERIEKTQEGGMFKYIGYDEFNQVYFKIVGCNLDLEISEV